VRTTSSSRSLQARWFLRRCGGAAVRRAWTANEDALFGKFNDKEIAAKTGRTLSSVENRRTRLKIRVPKPG